MLTGRADPDEGTEGGCHVVASGVVDRVAAGVTTGRSIIARPVAISLDLYAGQAPSFAR